MTTDNNESEWSPETPSFGNPVTIHGITFEEIQGVYEPMIPTGKTEREAWIQKDKNSKKGVSRAFTRVV